MRTLILLALSLLMMGCDPDGNLTHAKGKLVGAGCYEEVGCTASISGAVNTLTFNTGKTNYIDFIGQEVVVVTMPDDRFQVVVKK